MTIARARRPRGEILRAIDLRWGGGERQNFRGRALLDRCRTSRVSDSKGTFEGVRPSPEGEQNMAHKTPPSPLVIVGSPAPSAPPRPLGEAGTELWTTIQGEYAIADAGSVELLLQSCALADR